MNGSIQVFYGCNASRLLIAQWTLCSVTILYFIFCFSIFMWLAILKLLSRIIPKYLYSCTVSIVVLSILIAIEHYTFYGFKLDHGTK